MPANSLFPAELTDLSRLYDNSIAGLNSSPVIFGCGHLGRGLAVQLKIRGITPVALSDNNEMLWGQKIDGIPVLSPAEASHLYNQSHPFIVAVATVGFHVLANAGLEISRLISALLFSGYARELVQSSSSSLY